MCVRERESPCTSSYRSKLMQKSSNRDRLYMDNHQLKKSYIIQDTSIIQFTHWSSFTVSLPYGKRQSVGSPQNPWWNWVTRVKKMFPLNFIIIVIPEITWILILWNVSHHHGHPGYDFLGDCFPDMQEGNLRIL